MTSLSLTLPTKITLLRALCVPIIIMAIWARMWDVALGLFVFGALTDLLDGFLARYLHQTSVLGAYLDPIVDKVFILSCYGALAQMNGLPGLVVPGWFLFFMIMKECLLVAGTLYGGLFIKKLTVRPTWLGKGAMALQVFLIVGILVALAWNIQPVDLVDLRNSVALVASAALAQYAFIGYKGFFS